MILQEVTLESIDMGDETFRISEDVDSATMKRSLAEIGQLNPVLLLEESSRRVIVCGFRRLRALRELGRTSALAQTCSSADCSRLEAFRAAIFDNLSQREFSPLEKARILFTLKGVCEVTHETLVEAYLPLLGLPAHKNVLRTYLSLHALDSDLRRMFNDGRLTLAGAERLSRSFREAQHKFASLLARVRLSASRQREMLDLAEELASITDTALGEVFERAEIHAILEDSRLTPFQKGEQIYELLYRWRNPRLSRAEERFQVEKQQLGLPGAVRISPDPHFETNRLRVEFEVASAQRFREIAGALREAAEAPALEELFRVS